MKLTFSVTHNLFSMRLNLLFVFIQSVIITKETKKSKNKSLIIVVTPNNCFNSYEILILISQSKKNVLIFYIKYKYFQISKL